MSDFDGWLRKQRPHTLQEYEDQYVCKPKIWVLDEDLEAMGVEEIDGRMFTHCCICIQTFELDCSREEAERSYNVLGGFYCGGSPRCCP